MQEEKESLSVMMLLQKVRAEVVHQQEVQVVLPEVIVVIMEETKK